jgi:Uncharacterized protein conserved in bacteria (DUF2252)
MSMKTKLIAYETSEIKPRFDVFGPTPALVKQQQYVAVPSKSGRQQSHVLTESTSPIWPHFLNRREQVVKAIKLQLPSVFSRMIEAHDERVLVDSFFFKRSSVSERMAEGKTLRKQVPRSAQATYDTRADRPDPIEILKHQGATRIPKLLLVRYGRMLANPFAFLRGAAAIMASDLSPLPISGKPVVACGDAHVKNFGVYASAERNLIEKHLA